MNNHQEISVWKRILDFAISNNKINECLTLDAFKREDARARIRSNIRRLLIKNYPPIKREGAVDKVIMQAELKYQEI